HLAELGLVAFAGIPIDVLMAFYMFCCSLGEDPAQKQDEFISTEIGIKALKMFRQLALRVDFVNFHRNPIQVYEAMSSLDDVAYCPFAYGYSNYARKGYARNLLAFHDMISLDGRTRMRSTLGGTGLAVSASSRYIAEAVKYAAFTASPECQRTLYFDNGG